MRARRYLAIPALAALLAVGVAARSDDSKSPTRSASPVDPTVDAARYAWDRDVRIWTYTAAVNANQAKAWYERAAAEDARRAQEAAEAERAAEAARAANAARVTSAPKSLAPMSRPAPQPQPAASGGGAGGFLACTRQIESTNNYSVNTGNGYYGAYQFDDQTWHSVGGSGHASDASPGEQDARATTLYQQRGNAPWGGRC